MAELSDAERAAREARIQALQAQARADGDSSAWFEPLYAAALRGEISVPWEDGGVNPHLAAWLAEANLDGRGQRALEVGCGYGHGALALARLGFDVTAVDLSPTAIQLARTHNPHERIQYRQQDMLEPPEEFFGAFDLVVEVYTLQAIQTELRQQLIRQLPLTVAPGGTLLVVCRARDEDVVPQGPPWALAESEVRALAHADSELTVERLERFTDGESPAKERFLAVLRRQHT